MCASFDGAHHRPPGSSVHWDFPGKNTGVGCHALLQGTFLTQGSSPRLLQLLHRQASSLPLAPPGNPNNNNTHTQLWIPQRELLGSRLSFVLRDVAETRHGSLCTGGTGYLQSFPWKWPWIWRFSCGKMVGEGSQDQHPWEVKEAGPGTERRHAIIMQYSHNSTSLVAQLVKNPPAMRETWV